MPSANVVWPTPLTRFPTLWPGQFGVPGTDSDRGERMHCTGEVFYVDPNFPGVSDLRDGTSPTDPLRTVAAALTHCQPYRGDVVAVMANNRNPWANAALGYRTPISEEVVVNVPGVRIVGVCPSGSAGVVWTPASNGGTCITINANDVLVEGFYFYRGAYVGIGVAINVQYDGISYFGDYATVRHCHFGDSVDIGIQLDETWYCNFHDNVFDRCATYGIYVPVAAVAMQYSHIHHNTFMEIGTTAILAPARAEKCFIYGNRFYNENAVAQAVGATDTLIVLDATPPVTSLENHVSQNWLSCWANIPAGPGDIDDACTGTLTDAWMQNYCIDGPNTTIPT